MPKTTTSRSALLLHPSQGTPGPQDSSIGGPLLWPADEAWPCCSVPDDQEPSGETAVAMVPVAQFHRRDVPGEWWPEDVDLLQVLWCPNEHWDEAPEWQAEGGPMVEVRWRRAADMAGLQGQVGPGPERAEEELVPRACTFTVELADDKADDAVSRYDVWKLGGFPRWCITDPAVFRCGVCDRETELLFAVSSGDVTGVDVGRAGELWLFRCPVDHRHGLKAHLH
ncbi:hypothetical protein [Streptomyces sp. NPDC056527]|uniref:hypothetical protein n=1 Tax=Streptomyces sp. NPDC056527 TaxID=3345853 RepID=UPI003673BBDE